jgi:hypothetical protein
LSGFFAYFLANEITPLIISGLITPTTPYEIALIKSFIGAFCKINHKIPAIIHLGVQHSGYHTKCSNYRNNPSTINKFSQ